MNNRLDAIIDAARNLEREATLAKVGLAYSFENDEELVMPAGTSAHVRATHQLLTQLVALAQ